MDHHDYSSLTTLLTNYINHHHHYSNNNNNNNNNNKNNTDNSKNSFSNEIIIRKETEQIGFWIHGSQVNLLYTPSDFYSRLKYNLLQAKHRVILSALYLGHEEKDLIQTLRQALRQTPSLHVLLLMDYFRSTRGSPLCSVNTLKPLKSEFGDRISIKLYHTPDVHGWKKHWIPPRFNETIGLLHFKLYITDDTMIITGANLSRDYFTSRQDRYLELCASEVTQHYAKYVETVSTFAYNVTAQGDCVPPVPHPVLNPSGFRAQAHLKLSNAITLSPRTPSSTATWSSVKDTFIVPAFQAGPLRIHQEQQVMQALWKSIAAASNHLPPVNVWFTSGYFNLTPDLVEVLVNGTFQGQVNVLTASPEANSFYHSPGPSKFIPDAYTYLSSRFLTTVHRAGQTHRVHLSEYVRAAWTYHAKGVWLSTGSLPFATAVGSSNFGYRSMCRDLEAQVVLVTANAGLQKQLQGEVDGLWRYASRVHASALAHRRIPWIAKVSAVLAKTML